MWLELNVSTGPGRFNLYDVGLTLNRKTQQFSNRIFILRKGLLTLFECLNS